MRFAQVSAAVVLAFATFTQAAVILPRQDATQEDPNATTPQDPNATDNSTSVESQYPNMTDIGTTNGTWFLTAITSNAFEAYDAIADKMKVSINCLNFNITTSSNTSFDILGTGFVQNDENHAGVNGTAAGVFNLEAPDSNVNVSDSEMLWTAYFSQIYVNTAAWQNFTTGNIETDNNASSQAVPGTEPIKAPVYSKFIDSTGGEDTTNIDTILVWASQFEKLNNDNSTSTDNGDDSTQLTRRDGETDNSTTTNSETIYAIILSRVSHVDDDTFNKTLGFLPTLFTQNNVTLVNLNDTCTSNTDNGNTNGDNTNQ